MDRKVAKLVCSAIIGLVLSSYCTATPEDQLQKNTSNDPPAVEGATSTVPNTRSNANQGATNDPFQLVLPEEDVEALRNRLNQAFIAEKDLIYQGTHEQNALDIDELELEKDFYYPRPLTFGVGETSDCCSKNKAPCHGSTAPSATKHASQPCGDSNSSCSMPMYFENTVNSVILFHFWRTATGMQYAISLIIIFILSLSTVFLKEFRNRINISMLDRSNTFNTYAKYLILYALAFVVTLMDFAMMLVVMTYNVGIILVVCSAYAFGYILTSHAFVQPEEVAGPRRSRPCSADCCC
ncbi:hypothetical protein BaOVIS_022100 [Babesia ovis]|uniref:Copper transport protein n=1 Tax=Babesia ovis TaxID=5869 RepID=A0A9W5WVC4_BABOV|nr:hypothetical protein BaOVIS_022100 [Babesia ovis]